MNHFVSTSNDNLPAKKELGLSVTPLIILGVLLAIGLRMLAASMGQNYDMKSYRVVADIVCAGGNVYAETHRYNYGPVWFYIVGGLYTLFLKLFTSKMAFHYLVAMFLSLADLGIFFILWKKFTIKTAFFFFLNPVSIIITGYHSQFDNLALLFGLWSVAILDEPRGMHSFKQIAASLFLLGLSITTKHILFLFPLWLAVKFRNRWQKLLALFFPPLIFLISFLPYWNIGHEGIIQNVFLYKSFNNAPLLNLFFPLPNDSIVPQCIFFAVLAAGAVLFNKESPLHSLLIYTAMLVTFSSAIANQYLAIVVPFIAVFPNLVLVAYTVGATWFLLADKMGLHIEAIQQYTPSYINYTLLIFLLFIGFSWHLIKVTFDMRNPCNPPQS